MFESQFGSAKDGLKCHELQYWDRLEFDSTGRIAPLEFKAEFTLDV